MTLTKTHQQATAENQHHKKFQLNGLTAMISGGTTGIGLAIAKTLAANGAHTSLIGRETTPEARTFAATMKSRKKPALALAADLRNTEEIHRAHELTLNSLGPVDILINCAGSYPRIAWDEINNGQWYDAMETNLNLHFKLIKAVTGHMRAQRWGRIINIGSINARLGRPELTAYATAKAGLEGLTRSLARELGPEGITVNCVSPGAIEVKAENGLPAHHRTAPEIQIARQCLPRRGQPEDVAAAVVFLASPATDFITAQTIHVDGGWLPT